MLDVEDEARFADADLMFLADGINSRFRDDASRTISSPRSTCGPTASPGWDRPGRSTPSPSLPRDRVGLFIAHAYQYEPGRSTWIFETDADTFARAGLDGMSEASIRAT